MHGCLEDPGRTRAGGQVPCGPMHFESIGTHLMTPLAASCMAEYLWRKSRDPRDIGWDKPIDIQSTFRLAYWDKPIDIPPYRQIARCEVALVKNEQVRAECSLPLGDRWPFWKQEGAPKAWKHGTCKLNRINTL
jgi:hypothetical protein